MQNSDEGKAYTDLAKRVDEAISFMGACGLDMNSSVMKETEFYVSHEVRCAAGRAARAAGCRRQRGGKGGAHSKEALAVQAAGECR